mgnify:CR=1 FL=1
MTTERPGYFAPRGQLILREAYDALVGSRTDEELLKFKTEYEESQRCKARLPLWKRILTFNAFLEDQYEWTIMELKHRTLIPN